MTSPAILAPIAGDMQRVDALIRERLGSDVPLVRQVAEYLVAAGGKRLRPALLLLSAGACGCRAGARLELAAVVEFIHTATLLHDDVVDTRRCGAGARRRTRLSATRARCWWAISFTRAPSR